MRRSGRTTRLADECVQRLFANQGEWVEIKDHANEENPKNLEANFELCEIVYARFRLEHKGLHLEKSGFSLKLPLKT